LIQRLFDKYSRAAPQQHQKKYRYQKIEQIGVHHYAGSGGQSRRDVEPPATPLFCKLIKVERKESKHGGWKIVSDHAAALKKGLIGNEHHDCNQSGRPSE